MVFPGHSRCAGTLAHGEAERPSAVRRPLVATSNPITSMIDGKSYWTLRRHLSTNGMTPADYRERHHRKAEYPTIAAKAEADHATE